MGKQILNKNKFSGIHKEFRKEFIYSTIVDVAERSHVMIFIN